MTELLPLIVYPVTLPLNLINLREGKLFDKF